MDINKLQHEHLKTIV